MAQALLYGKGALAEVDIKEEKMLKLPGIVLSRFSLIFAMLSLAACGGGGSSGGSSDDGSDPGTVTTGVKPGIFSSTITYASGDTDPQAFTMLSSSGEYAILPNAPDGTFGTLTFRSDDTFSGNGTNVFLDETWQSVNGSLDGSAISVEKFIATFTAEPDVSSDITGTRLNDTSDLGVTIQELSGNYFMPGVTNQTAVTIGPDGIVTGSDTVEGSDPDKGCSINGTISIPDPAYNIFEGKLSLTNCADIPGGASSDQRDGEYRIIGFLRPSQGGVKDLVFAGTNDKVMFLFVSD